ncbi:MAG: hypothetical protein L0Z53_13115 [Acidobacteriales bacterium]|nr:hypothetical protein [Terriglobales bacterium]
MARKQSLSIALVTASVFCMLAVMPVLAQRNEPSLGEVARKNRADKAKRPVSKERKEELAPRPMSTATVTDYGSSASLGTSSGEASPNASPASSETSSANAPQQEPGATKPEPQAQNDRVAQIKREQETLNRIIEKMKAKLAAETLDSRRQTYGEVLRNTEQEMEKKQEELREAEKAAPKK